MISTIDTRDKSNLDASFLEEYSTEQSVRKYTQKTAGNGISYLLNHDYGAIYLDSIKKYVPQSRLEAGIRLWEFGCGGGMNVLHLSSLLGRRGVRVDFACGTDFSPTLIEAARTEARSYVAPHPVSRVRFAVARNEDLVGEGAGRLGVEKDELLGSFDLVFGVNTIRYGHRLKNVDRCVEGISALLREGGLCIIIDMNRSFPAFRSRLREWRARDEESTYLPSLDEYARPFSSAGFEILRRENFCWIPHSAGPGLTAVMSKLTPVLNAVARSRGMRSLVISRKPGAAV
jgi:SAM-dependent methyltransferase